MKTLGIMYGIFSVGYYGNLSLMGVTSGSPLKMRAQSALIFNDEHEANVYAKRNINVEYKVLPLDIKVL